MTNEDGEGMGQQIGMGKYGGLGAPDAEPAFMFIIF